MKKVDGILQREEQREWTSSKGNQNKWFDEGIWYKEDSLGYESLAEILVSSLLKKTNAGAFVTYEYEEIESGGIRHRGCKAKDFLEPGDDKLISVERLFQAYKGESAAQGILAFERVEDRLQYVVGTVEEITGLHHFGEYLRKILAIDTLFFNEDRHFHNLAVIRRKDGTYRECPIFDNGAALFSDTQKDYPLTMKAEECIEKIWAKPFSRDFDEQLDACEVLYGGFVFQASFTIRDVEDILAGFRGIYEEAVLERICEVMRIQLRKYSYFW